MASSIAEILRRGASRVASAAGRAAVPVVAGSLVAGSALASGAAMGLGLSSLTKGSPYKDSHYDYEQHRRERRRAGAAGGAGRRVYGTFPLFEAPAEPPLELSPENALVPPFPRPPTIPRYYGDDSDDIDTPDWYSLPEEKKSEIKFPEGTKPEERGTYYNETIRPQLEKELDERKLRWKKHNAMMKQERAKYGFSKLYKPTNPAEDPDWGTRPPAAQEIIRNSWEKYQEQKEAQRVTAMLHLASMQKLAAAVPAASTRLAGGRTKTRRGVKRSNKRTLKNLRSLTRKNRQQQNKSRRNRQLQLSV